MISQTRNPVAKQHRKYLVVRQNEKSTIVRDEINNQEYPFKKAYIPEGEYVILFLSSFRMDGSVIFQYSVLNDYKESEAYLFDIIEKKEKGFVIENNENIQLFIPLFYENSIVNNKIEITVKNFDLDKNHVFFESDTKPDLSTKIDPKNLFEINKSYDFKITALEAIDEEFSIFNLDYDGYKTTVRTYDFQSKEMIGSTLRCIVFKIVGYKLYLRQDKKALLSKFYNVGNNYKFTVKSLEKDEHTDYYRLEDKYGFTHRIYLNYFLEGSNNNIIETEQEYFLRKFDDYGNLILKSTSDPLGKFYNVENVFKSIGYFEKIEPYFYDLEEELKLEKYESSAFNNLFDLYHSNENTWIFSYLNFITQSHLKNLIYEKEYHTAVDVLKLTKKLEEWILEGSDYLTNFGSDKQERIITMAEGELKRIEYKIEALNKITSNTHIDYIENISKNINRISS